MWILKTDIAVGCHLVNLALEEVSLDVAVRGRMAAVIVFLHESFQFIGSRDASIVPIEFLNLADEVFGEFHVEVRVLVDAHVVHIDGHSHFLPVARCLNEDVCHEDGVVAVFDVKPQNRCESIHVYRCYDVDERGRGLTLPRVVFRSGSR